MARYQNSRIQQVSFSSIVNFSDGASDLQLTDIINDATKAKTFDNFVETPGAFEYELDLTVDEEKVIDLGVLGFKVEFFTKNPNAKVKRNPGGRSRANAAKERKNKTREYLLKKAPVAFMSFNIDLNIPLPTKSFQFLSTTIFNPAPKIHTAFFMTPPETDNKMFASNIIAKPLLSIKKNSGMGMNFTSLAKKSLKMGQDPSSMLAKTTPFFPTLAAKMSIASVALNAKPKRDQSKRIGLDNIVVRQSLNEEREKLEPLHEDNSDNAVRLSNLAVESPVTSDMNLSLGHVVNIQNSLFTVKRLIEISKSAVGMRENFWVRITPILKNENTLLKVNKQTNSVTFSVSHKRKVQDFLQPVNPPEITVIKDKKGVVILSINQVDPTASGVLLTRSVVTPRRDQISQSKVVSNFKLDANDPRKIVIDMEPGNLLPNSVMYRAITKSITGQDGPMSSIVLEGHYNVNQPTASLNPNELSIIAKNENERIRIDVEKIPSDVIGIRLLREEIDESGSLSDRVTTLPDRDGKTLNDTMGDVAKITYYDYSADLNRRYRYFCALRPQLGNEFLSEEDEVIIRKFPTKPLPVEVTLENSQVLKDISGNFTVSIDAISLPKPEGIDFILDLMKKSGVSDVFIDELKRSRSEMADLAVFIVERVNRNTGRRVSFGLQGSGTFKDDLDTRRKLRLPNLTPGNRYSYFFKLCLRPPQSFLRNTFVKFNSTQNPEIQKQANARKFLDAFASATGALPSAKNINSFNPGAEFRAGFTGVTLQLDVQTPKALPKPISLIRKSFVMKSSFLRWKASIEDVSAIDHCLVFVEMNDKKVLMGAVPASGSSRDFFYVDKAFSPQVGKKIYSVQFVYKDMTVSPSSNKVIHTTYASVPKAFFAKTKKIKILGTVPTLTNKNKISKKSQSPQKSLNIKKVSKAVGAPGWKKKV